MGLRVRSNKSVRWLQILGIALFCGFMSTCANVKRPTGGPDDKTPPQVVNEYPPNFSTNFSSRSISITFDEWVELNDIYNQLIISPPLSERPEVRLKKRTLFVEFQEELLPNTTYSLSFGEGVRDYRASNPASDLRYVFSTGSELDSLIVSGKVEDAYTNKGLEGVKVMLYDQLEDSIPVQEKPLYFGISDAGGNYTIPYLKEGQYRVVALIDENANYLVDEEEVFGWMNEWVNPMDSMSNSLPSIKLSLPKMSNVYVSDYMRDSTGYVGVVLNQEVDSLLLKPIDSAFAGQQFQPEKNDTSFFWMTDIDHYGEGELVVYHGPVALDTIQILSDPRAGKRNLKISGPGYQVNHTKPIELDGSRILEKPDTSLVEFLIDSVQHPFAVQQKDPYTWLLDSELSYNRNYRLTLLPGAIKSREGWSHDTLAYSFKTYDVEYYGALDFAIEGLDSSATHIFQLEEDGVGIRYEILINSDTTLSFPQMEPGKFVVRLINDENDNGIWDPGDYWSDRQPERVLYFPDNIQVRSNWVQELNWVIESSK